MKLKGVNPFEQHVERIVLIGVSAVFLLVVATQFLIEPNAVKVGNATVPPGKAFHAAEDTARRLKNVMDQTDLSLPPIPSVNLIDQFKARQGGPVAPHPTLAAAIGKPPAIAMGAAALTGKTGGKPITPLAIPAPARVAAASYASTFDPTEPINTPDLKKLKGWPTEQPFDRMSVSVEGHLDGTALAAAAKASTDTTDPLPLAWYRDSLEVMDVVLERQEQTGPDAWSDAMVVPSAPGRTTLAEQLKTVKSTSELADLAAEARSDEDGILRPAFYRTIAGEKWAPPSAATVALVKGGKSDAKNSDVSRLVKKHQDQEKRREAVTKQLDEAKAATVRERSRGGDAGGGGGGKGGAGAPGQRQPNTPTQKTFDSQATKDREIKRLETELGKVDADDKAAIDGLKALGLDEAGKPLDPSAVAATPGSPGQAPAAKPLLENPDVQVWVHDLNVEPGKVYRYRVKLAVSNPFFGRGSALLPDQQDLAKNALLYGQPSEWSEPVRVLDDQYYFITSAAEADATGAARATAEVFKFFYGYYRKASISVEPGDLIAASIKLPDPSKLPIYDLTALENPQGQPGQPAVTTPSPATPSPRIDPRGGGGKGGALGGGEGTVPINRPGQPQAGQPDKVSLPANAKPWPRPTIAAASDVILLDVAKSVSGEPASLAYLRSEAGTIIIRTPEEERRSQVYGHVIQSAKEGESQGQPQLTEPTKKNTPAVPPKNQTPTPPKGPSGGGGGGGAGGG